MGTSARNNHCDRSANQFGRQHWQAIELAVPPAVFDRHVVPLDIASILEALSERAQTVCGRFERSGIEKTDHWHRGLLRPRPSRLGRAQQTSAAEQAR